MASRLLFTPHASIPVVAVACVDVGAERGEIELELAGRVRAVDDREDVRRSCPRTQGCDVVHAPRRPLDVRDEDGLRPHARLEAVPLALDHARARAAGDVLPEKLHARVLVRCGQYLVARLERQRARDRVHRRGRVRREREIVSRDAQVRGEPLPGTVQQRRQPTLEREELDGLALELALPALVLLEHRAGRRPERPVVQEDDVSVEEEELFQLSGYGSAAASPPVTVLHSPLPHSGQGGRCCVDWTSSR
jgi:hypothetical protein